MDEASLLSVTDQFPSLIYETLLAYTPLSVRTVCVLRSLSSAMATKEAKFHDVSPDSDDYSDDQSLLEHALNPKTTRSQGKRHWAFLAVNAFVLLLNIGVLLMISAPKEVDEKADMKTILYPRFPHDGQ